MRTYYVQYVIRNIKPDYLKSYFSKLEKELRNIHIIEIKHTFITDGKVYINTHVKGEDATLISKNYLSFITGVAVNALNYIDEDNELKIDIEKAEVI